MFGWFREDEMISQLVEWLVKHQLITISRIDQDNAESAVHREEQETPETTMASGTSIRRAGRI